MVIRNQPQPINHGTNGGYQAHLSRKIPIDDEDSCGCRKARSVYMSEWRAINKAWKKRDKLNARIRYRVGAWLIERHPEEARALVAKARQEVVAEMKAEALKNV